MLPHGLRHPLDRLGSSEGHGVAQAQVLGCVLVGPQVFRFSAHERRPQLGDDGSCMGQPFQQAGDVFLGVVHGTDMQHPRGALSVPRTSGLPDQHAREGFWLRGTKRFGIHHVGHHLHRQIAHPSLHGVTELVRHRTNHGHPSDHVADGPPSPPWPCLGLVVRRPMLGQHHGHAPALGPSDGRVSRRIGHVKVHHVRLPRHRRRFGSHGTCHPQQVGPGRFVVQTLDHERVVFPPFLAVLFPHLQHRPPRTIDRHGRPHFAIVKACHCLDVPLDEVSQTGMNLGGEPTGHVQNLQSRGHASKVGQNQQTNVGRRWTLRQLEYLCAPFRTTRGSFEGHGGYSSAG